MGATCCHSNLYQCLQRFQKKQKDLLGGLKDDDDDDDDDDAQGMDNGGGGKEAGNMLIEGGDYAPSPASGNFDSRDGRIWGERTSPLD